MRQTVFLTAAAFVLLAAAHAEPATEGLTHHWVFTPEHMEFNRAHALAGGMNIDVAGPIRFDDMPAALRLDGNANQLLITEDLALANLPTEDFTAEAWVKVTVPDEIGGFIGAIQDARPTRGGWLLGYRSNRFFLALATEGTGGEIGRLTYLTAAKPFIGGRWYHVLGVYDGTEMRLYVDGALSASSREQSGPVRYPESAFFEIGAYHDDNRDARTKGSILDVRLYERALTEHEIDANFAQHADFTPGGRRLALGPYLQFEDQTSAVVRWRTAHPKPSVIEWHTGDEIRRFSDAAPKTRHALRVAPLERNTVYRYRILLDGEIEAASTAWYECDTMFNYALPPIPEEAPLAVNPETAARDAQIAHRIVEQTGTTEGYALLLGAAQPGLAWELAKQTNLRVIAVGLDNEQTAALRDALRHAGLYGPRITMHAAESYAALPFTKFFANLIVLDRRYMGDSPEGMADELARVLRPDGGKIFEVTGEAAGGWLRVVRPPLDDSGSWTHQYGTPDNSARSHDTLLGATGTDQLEVQWLGRPGPRAMVDRSPRTPAPLYAGGRLFTQGLHRIIAQDAYNGAVFWSLEIPSLQRYNMPRDCSNWCTDGDSVYAAVEDACWRIDAASGAVDRVYPVIAPHSRWDFYWGYVAREGELLYGSAVKRGTHYTNFWGKANAGWYDAAAGDVTHKVCSDALFALDKDSGELRWDYAGGAIINSTITIADSRVFFVECRNTAVVASDERRIGSPEFWEDQYLVALDAKTGALVWEQPLDIEPGSVVFYLIHANDTLVVALSHRKYHLYAFSPADGSSQWQAEHDWTSSHHSGHMQHPAVVGNAVYLEPCGYDLETGALLTDKMARHEGCATYMATEGALIHRGTGRRIAIWDVESGDTTYWERLRPGCWLTTMAGGGMVLSPEGGGGCSCGGWLETSLAFIRKDPKPRMAAGTP